MASLRQKPNGYWYIRYRDDKGKQRETATGTTLKTKAKKQLTETQGRIDRREAVSAGKEYVATVWTDFITTKDRSLTPATIQNYRTTWEHYLKDTFAHRRMESITVKDIQDWLNDVSIRTVEYPKGHYKTISPVRVNVMLTQLQAFWRWSIQNERDLPTHNPTLKVDPVNEGKGSKQHTISYDQAMLVLKHLHGTYSQVAFATLYFSGVRIGEMRGLTWDDIRWPERELTVDKSIWGSGKATLERHGKIFKQTKTGKNRSYTKTRTVPIPDALYDLLEQWKEDRDHERGWWAMVKENPYDLVFPGKRGKGFLVNMLRKDLRKALQKANAEYTGTEPFEVDKITVHTARHGFARAMASGGMPLPELMTVMGLGRYQTVLQYAGFATDIHPQLVSIFNDLDRGPAQAAKKTPLRSVGTTGTTATKKPAAKSA